MTPPLKPCPFCGSAPRLRPSNISASWLIECHAPDCFALVWGETEAVAVEKWNRRAEPVPSSVSSAIEEEANAARRRAEQICRCGHRSNSHTGKPSDPYCCLYCACGWFDERDQ